MLFLVGCASTDYTKSSRPASPDVPSDVPDWYMETPSDGEYVYVTGMGNGSNINIALGKAKALAQQEMSEKISAEVQSMVKNYMQESGVDDNQSSINFYESTSKTVSNNTMNGFEVLEKLKSDETIKHIPVILLTNLGEKSLKPNISSITNICPSQYFDAPIPIVGTEIFFVINLARFSITHSIIIANAPELEIAVASSRIFFF